MKIFIFCSFFALFACTLSNKVLNELKSYNNFVEEIKADKHNISGDEELSPRHLVIISGSVESIINIDGGNDKDIKIEGPNGMVIHKFKPTPNTTPTKEETTPLMQKTTIGWYLVPTKQNADLWKPTHVTLSPIKEQQTTPTHTIINGWDDIQIKTTSHSYLNDVPIETSTDDYDFIIKPSPDDWYDGPIKTSTDVWGNVATTADGWGDYPIVPRSIGRGGNFVGKKKDQPGDWQEIPRPKKIDDDLWEQIV